MSTAYVSGRAPARYERLVTKQARAARTSKSDLVLFRRTVRTTNYGQQARLLTDFWGQEGHAWDWLNRIVYLPKSP